MDYATKSRISNSPGQINPDSVNWKQEEGERRHPVLIKLGQRRNQFYFSGQESLGLVLNIVRNEPTFKFPSGSDVPVLLIRGTPCTDDEALYKSLVARGKARLAQEMTVAEIVADKVTELHTVFLKSPQQANLSGAREQDRLN